VFDVYLFVPGSLEVTKTISGASAGSQGVVTIAVSCGGLPLPAFTIPAGATGSRSHLYGNIPAGLTCTVIEEADGSSSTVGVVIDGSPQHVKITPNGAASAELTDTYTFVPGRLEVRKTISGPSAGSQGAITIAVRCAGTTLPTWTIPAGTRAMTLTHMYKNIPAGSSCTVTESSDGATTTVIAAVAGANQTVTVPAGITASLNITDTFSPAAGAVKAIKMLAGAGAGQQSRVGVLVVCGGPIQVFAFVIPARHPGGSVSQVFPGVGGTSKCLIAEVVNGHTSDVIVHAVHGRQVVTVPAAGLTSVRMTDRFEAVAVGPTQPPTPTPTPTQPAPPPLAGTGPRIAIPTLLGYSAAALLVGAGLLAVGRRRKRDH